ncbi:MAG: lipocalin-like domain-containing protein, partial [Actinomycetia bacterium]|nr:lipocalin-like domain-containing protein [Actinomycetes bacterium]
PKSEEPTNPSRSLALPRIVRAMHELIGTWRLVEWTFTVNDSRPTHPWGGDPVGLLTYSEDGRMSASLMSVGRPPAPTRTLSAAPVDIRAAAAAGYLSYAGAYTLEGDDVLHHIELSLMPNWVGRTERRHIEWLATESGKDLILSTPPTRTDGGRTAVNRLRWGKIRTGADAGDPGKLQTRSNHR